MRCGVVLLLGAPGAGKSLLGRCWAAEANKPPASGPPSALDLVCSRIESIHAHSSGHARVRFLSLGDQLRSEGLVEEFQRHPSDSLLEQMRTRAHGLLEEALCALTAPPVAAADAAAGGSGLEVERRCASRVVVGRAK